MSELHSADFPGRDAILGAPSDWDAARYGPCKGLPVMRRDGVTISKWKPTLRQRIAVLLGKNIWLHVASGTSHPPVALVIE